MTRPRMALVVKVCNKVFMDANEQVMPNPAHTAKGRIKPIDLMKNAGINAIAAKVIVITTIFPNPKTDFRAAK